MEREDDMISLFAYWILIIFEFGGFVCLIVLLIKTSKFKSRLVYADIQRVRSFLKWMIAFVFLATVSLTRLFIWTLGEFGLVPQFIVNLLTGIVFVVALLKLGDAFRPASESLPIEENKNKNR